MNDLSDMFLFIDPRQMLVLSGHDGERCLTRVSLAQLLHRRHRLHMPTCEVTPT